SQPFQKQQRSCDPGVEKSGLAFGTKATTPLTTTVNARLGLLLCPTTSFAALLCELGQQRALENSVRERAPDNSRMMSHEKAVRELPFLGFMFEMPIVVAGVGVSGR
ncbi:MAG: hypothetical protein M0T70_15470, partial [Geobacteraceae bacterium]|nr:hypothetical protein [Geobacteraceae bacterium]